ncbi:MAG: hypothetical protein PHT88_00955 [Candidatus Moranbacteria bacterium]|nr:hypothetical protein [Candidatus Moranbacteria bacterium]
MNKTLYACSIGIGYQHPETHARTKKAFVFDGFEQESLAKTFLDRLTTFIDEFIASAKKQGAIPENIWIDDSLKKMLHPAVMDAEIASVTVTDIAVIPIIPSNNLPSMLQEILRYFGIGLKFC